MRTTNGSIGHALIACVLFFSFVSTASASPGDVDEGISHFEDADFDEALAAFARAESGTGLERSDVERLLVHRARVYEALRDRERAERDLLALATLDPGYVLPREAPPSVRRAFEHATRRVPHAVAVTAELDREGNVANVVVRVDYDPTGLVRNVRLRLEAETDGPTADREHVTSIALPGAGATRLHVEAIGPGGARLVEQTLEIPAAPADVAATRPAASESPTVDRRVRRRRILLGVFGAALLGGAAATTYAVVHSQPSHGTWISSPTFPTTGGP